MRPVGWVRPGGVRAFIVPMPRGAVRGAASKTGLREGRQEVGCAMSEVRQESLGSADEAKQGTDAICRERWWMEASIWTERMVSALVNGVKVLRYRGAVHLDHSSLAGETLPMRKPATGEPCAGEPHARFGGRGGQKPSLPLSSGRSTDILETNEASGRRGWPGQARP